MRSLIVLTLAMCLFVACGPVSFWYGVRDRVQDEVYQPSPSRTIGFVPVYDDEELEAFGAHHLRFDNVYRHFESVLGDLGYVVMPMPANPSGPEGDIWADDPPEHFPELTLFVEIQAVTEETFYYDTDTGPQYSPPSPYANVAYSQKPVRLPVVTEKWGTFIVGLTVKCEAWAGPPNYERGVWSGAVSEVPEIPLGNNQVRELVSILIREGDFQAAVPLR